MSVDLLVESMNSRVTLIAGLLIGLALGSVLTFALIGSQVELYKERVNELQLTISKLSSKVTELTEELTSLKKSVGTTTVLLPDREYYSTAEKLIKRANESVLVAIYVIKYDPREENDPVNVLLKELVKAKKSGLNVKVLVDDATQRSYKQTIEFLRNNGVPVKLDESSRVTTHIKLVIIDHKYLLVGSHNWTESALSYNHEYSVLIISHDLARSAEKYFESLWDRGRMP